MPFTSKAQEKIQRRQILYEDHDVYHGNYLHWFFKECSPFKTHTGAKIN